MKKKKKGKDIIYIYIYIYISKYPLRKPTHLSMCTINQDNCTPSPI